MFLKIPEFNNIKQYIAVIYIYNKKKSSFSLRKFK